MNIKMLTWFLLLIAALSGSAAVHGQQSRTVLTGTVLSYGMGFDTRARTNNFTLYINGLTSESETIRLLELLENDGQDVVLNAFKNKDLGSFALGRQIGRQINFVRVHEVDGKKRIRIAFERWLGIAELREGYRSVDYPFSYIELFIDPRTGKGEGTYIAAARIRFRNDQVEVEDFGTFPSRLLNVKVDTVGTFL